MAPCDKCPVTKAYSVEVEVTRRSIDDHRKTISLIWQIRLDHMRTGTYCRRRRTRVVSFNALKTTLHLQSGRLANNELAYRLEIVWMSIKRADVGVSGNMDGDPTVL